MVGKACAVKIGGFAAFVTAFNTAFIVTTSTVFAATFAAALTRYSHNNMHYAYFAILVLRCNWGICAAV